MKQRLQNFSRDNTLRHWITNDIILSIEKGLFRENPKLVSINSYSKQKGVSRDTVEKAYARLRDMGYIKSVRGKGYFVNPISCHKLKVMILLHDLDDEIGSFCRELIQKIDSFAQTEIRLYLYEPTLLKEHIAQGYGSYHYYIVLPSYKPANDLRINKVLREIPETRLIKLSNTLGEVEKDKAIKIVLDRLAS